MTRIEGGNVGIMILFNNIIKSWRTARTPVWRGFFAWRQKMASVASLPRPCLIISYSRAFVRKTCEIRVVAFHFLVAVRPIWLNIGPTLSDLRTFCAKRFIRRRALGYLETTALKYIYIYSYGNTWPLLTYFFNDCGRWGHVFAAGASRRSWTKNNGHVTLFHCSWRSV